MQSINTFPGRRYQILELLNLVKRGTERSNGWMLKLQEAKLEIRHRVFNSDSASSLATNPIGSSSLEAFKQVWIIFYELYYNSVRCYRDWCRDCQVNFYGLCYAVGQTRQSLKPKGTIKAINRLFQLISLCPGTERWSAPLKFFAKHLAGKKETENTTSVHTSSVQSSLCRPPCKCFGLSWKVNAEEMAMQSRRLIGKGKWQAPGREWTRSVVSMMHCHQNSYLFIRKLHLVLAHVHLCSVINQSIKIKVPS